MSMDPRHSAVRTRSILMLFFLFLGSSAFSQCQEESFLNKCAGKLGDYMYLKSFKVDADQVEVGGSIEFNYVLSKGKKYVITVCDEKIESSRMVVKLYDRNKELIASSYDRRKRKHYPKLVYPCEATGVYYLEYSFRGSKANCGVSILGVDQ